MDRLEDLRRLRHTEDARGSTDSDSEATGLVPALPETSSQVRARAHYSGQCAPLVPL
jgi:hypothetical protein